jgi:hypothetical protein
LRWWSGEGGGDGGQEHREEAQAVSGGDGGRVGEIRKWWMKAAVGGSRGGFEGGSRGGSGSLQGGAAVVAEADFTVELVPMEVRSFVGTVA